jgi:hypothetical protein
MHYMQQNFYSFDAHIRLLVLLHYFTSAETLLAENLAARIPGFTMKSFSEMLATRPEEVSAALVLHQLLIVRLCLVYQSAHIKLVPSDRLTVCKDYIVRPEVF